MNKTIRKATREDIPQIKEVRFSVQENRMSDPSSITDQDIEWFIDNAPIWVWDQGGKILGFSAGDPRDGSVWALFVRPESEGQGIGKALFERCCDSLKQSGHKTLTLSTQSGSRAEKFYRAHGWQANGYNKKNEIVLKMTL